jgi:hypothetical protein
LKRKKKEKKLKSKFDIVPSKKDPEGEINIDSVIDLLESDRRQKERVVESIIDQINISEIADKLSSVKRKSYRTKKDIENDIKVLNKVLQ